MSRTVQDDNVKTLTHIGSLIGSANGGVTVSANGSRGSYAGEDVTNRNSHLSAGNAVRVTTPDTLTIAGATLSGDKVAVNAGDLRIESRQDTSTWRQSNKSLGGSLTFNGGVSGSLNASSGKPQGDFASVGEQSGVHAGKQGFDIAVQRSTELKGGVIASEAGADKNRLSTGTLWVSDIQNRENWRASEVSLGIGYGSASRDRNGKVQSQPGGAAIAGAGPGRISANPPVAMNAKGAQTGTTYSAIAPGTIAITSNDPASLVAAGSVSRDTATANAGALVKQFDEAQRAEIERGFDAARTLSGETATFFANRAAEEQSKRAAAKEAERNGDAATAARLTREADDLRKTYGSGSAARLIATALNGAAGSDVTGSVGGLVRSAAVNVIQSRAATEVKYLVDRIGDPAQREAARTALQGIVGCAGAAAGGSGSCGAAAMGAAASVVVNTLIDSLDKAKPQAPRYDANGQRINDNNLEDQQTRANQVAALTAAIAGAAGLDPASATLAAQIETENNQNISPIVHAIAQKFLNLYGKKIWISYAPGHFSHAASRHFGSSYRDGSIFNPSFQNEASLIGLASYAANSEPLRPTQYSNIYRYTADYGSQVGVLRGSGKPTTLITFSVRDTGMFDDKGRRVMAPVTIYPGASTP